MCIIIDTNTLANVFDKNSAGHDEFKPVYDWIMVGKGKVVYGGTKYLSEIGKHLSVFAELNRAKKAVNINKQKVDDRQVVVSDMIQHKDFDDQHLVALLLESQCKLICSLDKRASPYFRHNEFFSPANKKPKIYSNKGNKDLLSDRNIAEICKPCANTTNLQKGMLSNIKLT